MVHGGWPLFVGRKPSARSHQMTANSHRPAAISQQPTAHSHQMAANSLPPAAGDGPLMPPIPT
jgi:hypothetical protein